MLVIEGPERKRFTWRKRTSGGNRGRPRTQLGLGAFILSSPAVFSGVEVCSASRPPCGSSVPNVTSASTGKARVPGAGTASLSKTRKPATPAVEQNALLPLPDRKARTTDNREVFRQLHGSGPPLAEQVRSFWNGLWSSSGQRHAGQLEAGRQPWDRSQDDVAHIAQHERGAGGSGRFYGDNHGGGRGDVIYSASGSASGASSRGSSHGSSALSSQGPRRSTAICSAHGGDTDGDLSPGDPESESCLQKTSKSIGDTGTTAKPEPTPTANTAEKAAPPPAFLAATQDSCSTRNNTAGSEEDDHHGCETSHREPEKKNMSSRQTQNSNITPCARQEEQRPQWPEHHLLGSQKSLGSEKAQQDSGKRPGALRRAAAETDEEDVAMHDLGRAEGAASPGREHGYEAEQGATSQDALTSTQTSLDTGGASSCKKTAAPEQTKSEGSVMMRALPRLDGYHCGREEQCLVPFHKIIASSSDSVSAHIFAPFDFDTPDGKAGENGSTCTIGNPQDSATRPEVWSTPGPAIYLSNQDWSRAAASYSLGKNFAWSEEHSREAQKKRYGSALVVASADRSVWLKFFAYLGGFRHVKGETKMTRKECEQYCFSLATCNYSVFFPESGVCRLTRKCTPQPNDDNWLSHMSEKGERGAPSSSMFIQSTAEGAEDLGAAMSGPGATSVPSWLAQAQDSASRSVPCGQLASQNTDADSRYEDLPQGLSLAEYDEQESESEKLHEKWESRIHQGAATYQTACGEDESDSDEHINTHDFAADLDGDASDSDTGCRQWEEQPPDEESSHPAVGEEEDDEINDSGSDSGTYLEKICDLQKRIRIVSQTKDYVDDMEQIRLDIERQENEERRKKLERRRETRRLLSEVKLSDGEQMGDYTSGSENEDDAMDIEAESGPPDGDEMEEKRACGDSDEVVTHPSARSRADTGETVGYWGAPQQQDPKEEDFHSGEKKAENEGKQCFDFNSVSTSARSANGLVCYWVNDPEEGGQELAAELKEALENLTEDDGGEMKSSQAPGDLMVGRSPQFGAGGGTRFQATDSAEVVDGRGEGSTTPLDAPEILRPQGHRRGHGLNKVHQNRRTTDNIQLQPSSVLSGARLVLVRRLAYLLGVLLVALMTKMYGPRILMDEHRGHAIAKQVDFIWNCWTTSTEELLRRTQIGHQLENDTNSYGSSQPRTSCGWLLPSTADDLQLLGQNVSDASGACRMPIADDHHGFRHFTRNCCPNLYLPSTSAAYTYTPGTTGSAPYYRSQSTNESPQMVDINTSHNPRTSFLPYNASATGASASSSAAVRIPFPIPKRTSMNALTRKFATLDLGTQSPRLVDEESLEGKEESLELEEDSEQGIPRVPQVAKAKESKTDVSNSASACRGHKGPGRSLLSAAPGSEMSPTVDKQVLAGHQSSGSDESIGSPSGQNRKAQQGNAVHGNTSRLKRNHAGPSNTADTSRQSTTASTRRSPVNRGRTGIQQSSQAPKAYSQRSPSSQQKTSETTTLRSPDSGRSSLLSGMGQVAKILQRRTVDNFAAAVEGTAAGVAIVGGSFGALGEQFPILRHLWDFANHNIRRPERVAVAVVVMFLGAFLRMQDNHIGQG
ncbi:unnamed protein product [Amoebophrya sp. A25]|nr:unnamed protein product [Amoebophrya sp. A25]|eukprot:GSA25T00004331001.1